MKVLQINNVYGEKSTGKITKTLHEGLLREGHDSVVVYGRGRKTEDPGVIRLCPDWYGKWNSLLSRFTGIRYGGCVLSTYRLKRIILREQPDIVHLQCINGNFVNIFQIVNWLKRQRIKTVLTLHAEFMYTANCGHAFSCDQWKHGCKKCADKRKATKSLLFDRTAAAWKKMRKAFSGFEADCVICSVSPWTESRARQSDIMKDFQHKTVYNGIDTETVFHAAEDNQKSENMVLNVTALFSDEEGHSKGGWQLIRLAERMPDVTFCVAGSATVTGTLPENVALLGEIIDQRRLAELYRQAAVSLIVSKKETFSMPCAESLCCGTPVVGFKAGAPEQISLPDFSEFTEYGDLDQLEAVLRKWLAMENLNSASIAAQAEAVYSSSAMIRNYLDVYRSLLWN